MTWKPLYSKKEADFSLFTVFDEVVKLPNGLQLNYYRIIARVMALSNLRAKAPLGGGL